MGKSEGERIDVRFSLTARIPVHAVALSAFAVSGCSLKTHRENIEPVAQGRGYQAEYRSPRLMQDDDDGSQVTSRQMNAETCKAPLGGAARKARGGAALGGGEALSRGDVLDIRIIGDDTFTHSYIVSQDGTVKLPFIGAVPAAGRSASAVQQSISDKLVAQGFYQMPPQLSVLVSDYGSATVGVAGAVFEPHTIELGLRGPNTPVRQDTIGSATEARNLSAALRAAGGVRPDADLSAVQVVRGGVSYTFDMRGAVDGTGYQDVMLISGDQVTVPSRGCFQEALMKPGPISPPGISLFLSNLTVPASANAPSAISNESRQVPYGTRFLQAVINANCVGGIAATSASRSAALVSHNPQTGTSVVIQRSIEDLMSRADRDNFNPYLLPGDAIACYDSTVTNITDVARSLTAILGM